MTNTVAKDQRRDSHKNHSPNPRDKDSLTGRNDSKAPKSERQQSHVQECLQWSFAT